jgi:hypothetical protein
MTGIFDGRIVDIHCSISNHTHKEQRDQLKKLTEFVKAVDQRKNELMKVCPSCKTDYAETQYPLYMWCWSLNAEGVIIALKISWKIEVMHRLTCSYMRILPSHETMVHNASRELECMRMVNNRLKWIKSTGMHADLSLILQSMHTFIELNNLMLVKNIQETQTCKICNQSIVCCLYTSDNLEWDSLLLHRAIHHQELPPLLFIIRLRTLYAESLQQYAERKTPTPTRTKDSGCSVYPSVH